jgi:AmiR/NasT family two-component response regulator
MVITEIKMPEVDAIDTAVQIYRDKPMPAILVPVHQDANLVECADMDHIMAYLVKPIQQGDLTPSIAIAVRRFEQFKTIRRETTDPRQALADR